MAEEISLLVDGELDEGRAEIVYRRLKDEDGRGRWNCYHMIGDCLRLTDARDLPASIVRGDFSARLSAALADEPTVLAPASRHSKPAFVSWAVAATLAAVGFVGWIASQEFANNSTPAVARVAAEASQAQMKRAENFGDYVAVHQQYAPVTEMENLRPFIRNATSEQDTGR